MTSTVFQTILAGVIVFVLGQIVLKLLIDPVQQFKRTLGEISHALVYHASSFSNPGVIKPEMADDAWQKLRHFSAQLHADLRVIPCYRFMRVVSFLPTLENVRKAQTGLIGLSNGIYSKSASAPFYNLMRAQEISDALGIYTPEHERVSREQLQKLAQSVDESRRV